MKATSPKSVAKRAGRTSIAWPPFAKKLASALATLEENQFLVLSVKQSNRFVQFAAQGAFGMRAETTSNNYLHKQEQLDARQIAALLALGWSDPTGSHSESTPENDPDGSPNFFSEFNNPVPFDEVADLTIQTLTQILRVPHPGFLEYSGFDVQGNLIAFPELGLRATSPAKSSDGLLGLSEQLLTTLKQMTGIADLTFDEDGDIGIQYGSALTFVRIIGNPRYVRFYSAILRKVEESGDLFSRLNDMNANERATRFVLQNGVLYAWAETPAQPFVSDHVVQIYQRFCAVVDGMGSLLQAEFGGLTSFSETPTSPTRH